MSTSLALFICAGYISLLFLIAYISDRRARLAGFRAPLPAWIFTLSISVYCTSWTFYGSVGLASRSGLEFTAIYLGPTLVFLGWWFVLRKIVRITKQQRITSIADFISSRFGKSERIALMVTLTALLASTPYLALQLKAVAQSFDLISQRATDGQSLLSDSGFWVAVAMALFAILFGTRRGSADEHYPGVISAIAFEAIIKLLALLIVGAFITQKLFSGGLPLPLETGELEHLYTLPNQAGGRWFSLLFLSGVAVLCLPRQFQVTAVEAVDENHFKTASWLFPLYLFLMSLFVIPIAIAGHVFLGSNSNPDQYVLTIPLYFENAAMATIAFIGGFSSATSMVIVASIALSIMISNHMILPLFLNRGRQSFQGQAQGQILLIRQLAIAGVLALSFFYYRLTSQSDALASMGLIAFVGVAQFFPAMMAALFWRQAAERAAFWALVFGFCAWAFTLVLPAVSPTAAWVQQGVFGLHLLRPQSLLGATGLDPVPHALLWSFALNVGALLIVSLQSQRTPLEQLQERIFVDAFSKASQLESKLWRRSTALSDLTTLSTQILGKDRTAHIFETHMPGGEQIDAADTLVYQIEQELAASIGAPSARQLVARISKGESLVIEDMSLILDQTQQALDYARELEQKSTQLEETASSLRKALVQLHRLDKFKDEFISHISHELKTPMTSLKSFAEILQEDAERGTLNPDQRARYFRIMRTEALRLTDLIHELLDIQQNTIPRPRTGADICSIGEAVRNAQDVFAPEQDAGVLIFKTEDKINQIQVMANPARLTQVFVNLISNSLKYSGANPVQMTIRARTDKSHAYITVRDNGQGFPQDFSGKLFKRYERASEAKSPNGTGLGLAITKQIILAMDGQITAAKPGERCGAGIDIRLPVAAKEEELKQSNR